jgi:hypothetical protein
LIPGPGRRRFLAVQGMYVCVRKFGVYERQLGMYVTLRITAKS